MGKKRRYSESGVWRLLKGLNFSRQRPSGRAIQRDEEAIERWFYDRRQISVAIEAGR